METDDLTGRLGRAQDLGLDALAARLSQDDGGRGHGDAAVRRGRDNGMSEQAPGAPQRPPEPLTSNDAPMGYLPVLTNLTHWPWFLNLVPKFFQPPFLH